MRIGIPRLCEADAKTTVQSVPFAMVNIPKTRRTCEFAQLEHCVMPLADLIMIIPQFVKARTAKNTRQFPIIATIRRC